jgi:RimJ/RimL family protein N-acetyltransferase
MPLEGDRIRLREERPSDMAFLASLRNNLETQGWSKILPPDYTEAMYRKRFEERTFSFDPDEGRFIIEEKESGQIVGNIGYSGLRRRHSATIGLAIAKPYWGTGMAFEAQETLLKFLFTELGLRVVRLWTHSGNPRAVGLAEKSGFRISVRMRESIFQRGKRYDNLMMDLLREEYFSRHPEVADDLPSI